FVHSQDRELKEAAMQKRVQNLFLEKLQYLKDGLTIKRRTKAYEKVLETIGKLKGKYSAIAQYYSIVTTKDPNGVNAIDIVWSEKKSLVQLKPTNQ
ncbi:MAG: hypothetical protein DRG30_10690, partial [Epsilonproteobacteria bacterium]